MPITSHPQQNESTGQLGKVKANLTTYTDADHQIKAEHWNEAVARLIEVHAEVGLTDGSEPGTHAARLLALENYLDPAQALVICDDDSFANGAWFVSTSNNGKAQISRSSTALGYPSSGVVLLGCTTDGGSKAFIQRYGVGAVLDTGDPITVEWWTSLAFNGSSLSDDQCQWFAGSGSTDGQNLVALFAGWSGSARTWALATFTAGVPTIDTITTPAAGTSYHWRMTITKGAHTQLEVSVDGGAFTTLGTSTVNPPLAVYSPTAQISKDTGAGGRTLPIDRVRMVSTRRAASAGSFVDDTLGMPIQFLGYGTTSTTACVGNDSRLSDARTPTAHATSHESGGGDALDLHLFAAPSGDVGMGSHKITSLADGSANTDAPSKRQVDQVQTRVDSTTSATIASGDIGGEIELSNVGAITLNLADLSSSVVSGRTMVILVTLTGGGSLTVASPGGGVTLTGAASGGLFTTLRSKDGLAWFAA